MRCRNRARHINVLERVVDAHISRVQSPILYREPVLGYSKTEDPLSCVVESKKQAKKDDGI